MSVPRKEFIATQDLAVPSFEEDSIEELKKVCKNGKYKFTVYHDKFKNGIMVTISIWHMIHPRSKRKAEIYKTTKFYETENLDDAVELIAGKALRDLFTDDTNEV